ncbi:hypothetical protein ACFE04_030526 [Oxalis oulophora]
MFESKVPSKLKYSLFSITLTLGALVFIIYQYIIICHFPFVAIEIEVSSRNSDSNSRITTTIVSSVPLHSIKEDTVKIPKDGDKSLLAPLNVSEKDRIDWFRNILPKFKIFHSNNLTRQFHGRVRQFFNKECELQFFMTWISPASSFGRREFLAMETLFNLHPNGCLIIISRSLDSLQGSRILKPLTDRSYRVKAVSPDLNFLFKNTPAESWFREIRKGNKDPGEIPLSQNLSNLIRLAILYKYGGIYLDTDFITIKSFQGLKNTIGAQSSDVSNHWTRLNNAVLVFDMNHPLLKKFMEEFALTFDGNKWGHNGPYLVSRVAERVKGRIGYNFTILPPMAFYPVDWTKIGRLFRMPENQAELKWVSAKLLQLNGQTYGVHLWNKQSSGLRIEEGSVMQRLISSHCIICQRTYSS